MRAQDRLQPPAVQALKSAILDSSGNEILAIGRFDNSGLVVKVTVAARGHSEAVPALAPYLEQGDVVIHNHPSGNLAPSSADLMVAARLGEQGIGTYIVDNAVERIYVVAEAVCRQEITRLDVSALETVLEEGGTFSRHFPGYERRESQIQMLGFICRSFNSEEICIAEAGTGVGKSLAYLLPVVDWVNKNKERIVVSTATINLQQQLIEKDIPLVERLLGTKPGACLVKGRGNYLCLRRLHEALEESSLFEEEVEGMRAIAAWAGATETGSRSDLPFFAGDELWWRVCSEADACLGLRCPRREGCFVLQSRRQAAASRLLVTNHHLLFADLALRLGGSGYEGAAVLPAFQHIVFDEAHNIERSASSYFSKDFSWGRVIKYIHRIYRRKGSRSAGLLPGLERLLGQNNVAGAARKALELISDRADLLNRNSLQLFDGTSSFRLTPATAGRAGELLLEPMAELKNAIVHFLNISGGLLEDLDEGSEESLVHEFRLQLKRLAGVSEICGRFNRHDAGDGDIFWAEVKKNFKGETYTRFVVTPLDIAPLMREAVFEPFKTLVFTSATLTVNKRFDYWKQRVGLLSYTQRELVEGQFSSPFNYRERVLLGIPVDAPQPNQEDYAAFVSRMLQEVLLISEGRALVLFTSYALLQETALAVAGALAGAGITLLRQGQEDRSKLLKCFQEETSSVLFATDSFWEGIDAPGESLELVVLTRLPFRVPSDPVLQARTEAIQAQGGNPFWELSLPDAIIRLKQGFGRLMRRHSDRGAVLILDSRIAHKSYGRYFLDSLPETARIDSSFRGVVDAFEEFIVAIRKKEEHPADAPP